MWCPRLGTATYAFGRAAQVIALASGRPEDDAWVRATAHALDPDRLWKGGNRIELLVTLGAGTTYHVTAAVNRGSILRHGSTAPEAAGPFLCDDIDSTPFFARMSRRPVDTWAVDVDGLWLEGDPGAGRGESTWMICPAVIEPARLRLIQRDVRPGV